jgi:hypothetical protein
MHLKREYHYLVAGLPDLLMDEGRQKASVAQFKSEFKLNLHPEDYKLVSFLFLKWDNANLLNLLMKKYKKFIGFGNISRETMEDEIKDPANRLFPYQTNFILKFKAGEKENSGTSWESELDNDFFDYLLHTENQFLRDWFEFKLNLQNITTALACRTHDISPEFQLVGKNIVTEHILRSNANDFGLMQEFPEIERILAAWENSESLTEREKAVDQLKWDWIDDKIFFHYFTVERLLGFILQLEMVERWMKLEEQTGQKLFNKLLSGLNESFELPGEFNLQYVKRK